MYSWKDKSKTLECQDFTTGDTIIINLPDCSPAEYAQRLYKSAKKLRRSTAVYEALLKQITIHYDYLKELDAAIENVGDHFNSYDDIIALDDIDDELDALEDVNLIMQIPMELTGALGNSISSAAASTSASTSKTGKDNKTKNSKSKNSKTSSKKKENSSKQSNLAKQQQQQQQQSAQSSGSRSKKLMQGLLVLRPKTFLSIDSSSAWKKKTSSGSGSGSGDEDVGDDISSSSPTPPAVVVGRSARQNERVSFEVAREHQLWFHVQGAAGAHCLLQLQPGEQASSASIQYAADVASFFSKAKGSGQVPCVYCSPKHLRRITGGGVGMVSILQQEGVVYGNPDRGKAYVEESQK